MNTPPQHGDKSAPVCSDCGEAFDHLHAPPHLENCWLHNCGPRRRGAANGVSIPNDGIGQPSLDDSHPAGHRGNVSHEPDERSGGAFEGPAHVTEPAPVERDFPKSVYLKDCTFEHAADVPIVIKNDPLAGAKRLPSVVHDCTFLPLGASIPSVTEGPAESICRAGGLT
jgi:hypothetical protein